MSYFDFAFEWEWKGVPMAGERTRRRDAWYNVAVNSTILKIDFASGIFLKMNRGQYEISWIDYRWGSDTGVMQNPIHFASATALHFTILDVTFSILSITWTVFFIFAQKKAPAGPILIKKVPRKFELFSIVESN